jgi:uncharacterized membrane protein YraQ (UPF0718 family)
VGNVPLAAVLWRGGISFGGVVSFIFADLIILPILDIYRKYYGWKVMGYILVTFYITMAAAGYVVELLYRRRGEKDAWNASFSPLRNLFGTFLQAVIRRSQSSWGGLVHDLEHIAAAELAIATG